MTSILWVCLKLYRLITSLFSKPNSMQPTKGARLRGGGSCVIKQRKTCHHLGRTEEQDDFIIIHLYQGIFGKAITLTSGGTPPTKNTTSFGSMSNSESVPRASPFWINFCSSVELWLGMVRKTFPCLPSLQAKSTKGFFFLNSGNKILTILRSAISH